jgi:hypothetical protein
MKKIGSPLFFEARMNDDDQRNEAGESAARANYEIGMAVLSAKAGIGHSKEQVFEWLDAFANGEKRPIAPPDVFPAAIKPGGHP